MMTFGNQQLAAGQPGADQPAVEVLRGSAIAPKAPAPPPVMGPERWDIVSGQRAWLVDPVNGDVVACRLDGSTEVGVRRIRCTTADLPPSVTD